MTERLWDEIFNDFMAISQNRPILEWWWDNICERVWRHCSGDSINYWLTPGYSQPTGRTLRTQTAAPGLAQPIGPSLSQRGQPVRWLVVVSHVLTVLTLSCGGSISAAQLCLQDHRAFTNQHPAGLSGHNWARTVISVSANSHYITVSSANIVLSLSPLPRSHCCTFSPLQDSDKCSSSGHPGGWRSLSR